MNSDKLGLTGKDKITGFVGIITGHCEYISGCDQLLLTPRMSNDKLEDGRWYDDQRIDIMKGQKKIVLDNDKTPGFDIQAPVK
jgi:hypothetical protein